MESRYQHADLKAQPKPFRGLPAPLFERLTATLEESGASREPFRSHAWEGTLDSIRSEVGRLLNTRLPPGSTFPPVGAASVIHYGLPDFSHLNAASALERDALAQLLSRLIEAFEPRLRQVRITLEAVSGDRRLVVGHLDAMLQLGLLSEPVRFPLGLHTSIGTATLGPLIDVESVP